MKDIEKILRKNENERTLSEHIQLIDQKYQEKKKMFYEEFLLLSLVYDNVYFVYNQTEYQIDSGLSDVTSLFIIENNEKVSKKLIIEEKYCSVFELFNKARIDGKKIRDIWDEVVF